MFFDDVALVERKRAQLKVLPTTPDTGWRPPVDHPDLSQAIALGFDFEVKELDFEHGPGWSRGKSSIVGGSLYALFRDGSSHCEYRPIRHEVDPQYNLDCQNTINYWRDTLQTEHIPKFGANLQYDIGNAAEERIWVQGQLNDQSYAEALLDDTAFVSLEATSQKYLGVGKESDLLYKWCAEAYGGKPTSKQRENIYRTSPLLVGPYGEADAAYPVLVMMKQWPLLRAADMLPVFRLENDLIPLMVKMRMQGVRINVDKAVEMYSRIKPFLKKLYKELIEISGVQVECTTGNDIKKVFTSLNIKTPRTEASETHPDGQMSVTAEWLKRLDHPVARVILDIRKLEIIHNTFLKSYLIDSNVNGILHGEYHQLKGEDGGAKTARFSSSNPNLTNIPSRVEKESEFGKISKEVRECFIPFEGHSNWLKGDYSQLQYRALAHYAVGPGSDELRAKYNNDPDVDYHDLVQIMIRDIAHREMDRRPVKNVNFSVVMGGGMNALKKYILESETVIKEILRVYHLSATYVKPTLAAISGSAQRLGYCQGLDGRRCSFSLWEPSERDYDNPDKALPYEWAVREYGYNIQRAGTHAAVSYMLQMAEGAIIKASLRRAYQEGIFDIIGVPTMLVHDEANFSQKDQSKEQKEAYTYLNQIMETTMPLRVPVKFKMDTGVNWGAIE